MCTIRLIDLSVAWQNSKPVSCKMNAFLQTANSFALLNSGFVWYSSFISTKTQPYIFPIAGLRFVLQDTRIEKPDDRLFPILLCSCDGISFSFCSFSSFNTLRQVHIFVFTYVSNIIQMCTLSFKVQSFITCIYILCNKALHISIHICHIPYMTCLYSVHFYFVIGKGIM